jgi:excinuclease UvrABC nuclease subunit
VLTQRIEFSPENDADIFSAIPAAPAVFLIRGEDPQAEPYVSKTANLRRRLIRLLGESAQGSKRLNLRQRACWIEYTATGSDFESGFLLYRVLRTAFPKSYGNRLRLRFAPFVKMHVENEYPRASITTRLGKLNGRALYYGPFPSRAAAEKFANDSLDFFKMRRCVDDLHPDPAFPGCIYSEMKMCLAPCFKGCTDGEYRAEVSRVQAYFDSAGESLRRELTAQREQASSDLEFENAAAIHARIEKLKPVVAQLPEIVHRLDRLNGVMIQRSAEPESVSLFRIDAGCVSGPATFSIQQQIVPGGKAPSMESRVQEAVEAIAPASPKGALELMEHIAILKRWYFRSSRLGEIFFADEKNVLPLRRIVRGIGRVYKGEKAEAPAGAEPPSAVFSSGTETAP